MSVGRVCVCSCAYAYARMWVGVWLWGWCFWDRKKEKQPKEIKSRIMFKIIIRDNGSNNDNMI